MASEFIETMQKVEETVRLISKMGASTLEDAVNRINIISDFISRYGDMGPILAHLKEIESKLFMFKEMLTLDEAAGSHTTSPTDVSSTLTAKILTNCCGPIPFIPRRLLSDRR